MLALAWLLVSGLMLSAFGALTTSASAQEVLSVPRNWTLKPEGLAAGTPFRLLFVANSGYRANSADIATYNTAIQEEAARSHIDRIRPFASKFRALASTASTDARDNTATTYTSTNTGVSIWWLRGDKIADNYQDFYDGSWDNKSGSGKNEDGAFLNNDTDIWTGSKDDGTKADVNTTSGSLSGPLGSAQVSWIRPSSSETLWKQNQASVNTEFKALIGLSPIFQESNEFEVSLVEMGSRPVSSSAGYAAGEVIRVQLQFAEHVIVTGTPYVVLNIGGNARRALYETGSGTYFLTFRYTVVASDFDANGVSLCSDRTLDRACGQIALNGGMIRTEADSTTTTLIRELPEFGNQDLHKVDGNPTFMLPPGTPPMPVPSAGTVPPGWALTPTGVGRGNGFRLLFLTSTTQDATSSNINDYNNIVIARAGTGHSAIQAFKDGFRVIGSTQAVDAKDNADLTGTGVPIYWLDGAKAADNYSDFLDGSWDDTNAKDESGNSVTRDLVPWTGSTAGGIEKTVGNITHALGTLTAQVGRLSTNNPLDDGSAPKAQLRRLYGLSQVLTAPPAEYTGTATASTPRRSGIYRVGETIAISWTFNERVAVRGVPTLALTLNGNSEDAQESVRTMRYASGSGTMSLRFEYVVQNGDFSERSNTPLVISALAGESPITLDGARILAAADNSDVNIIPSETEAFRWTSSANHKVETRAPVVTEVAITSSPRDRVAYRASEAVTTRLTTRDPVRVTGRPYIELNVNSVRRRADYVGPISTATSRLEFRYRVQSDDFDADGIGVYGTIHLNGGSIRSAEDPRLTNLALQFEDLESQIDDKVDGRETPTGPTECTAEIGIGANWAFTPDGLDVGEKFRLLFVTSTGINGISGSISTYNSHVQNRAANGHGAIRGYSQGFRALASTGSTNARTNTCTRPTDISAPIYWLNGEKVADGSPANAYSDLYDGSWDSNEKRNEIGETRRATSDTWTGTNANGTTSGFPLGSGRLVTFGRPGASGSELSLGQLSEALGKTLYGLSQTFVVEAGTATTGISVISEPSLGDTYRRGERIEVEVTYGVNVVVSGTPRIALAFATHDRGYLVRFDASYLRGSGTNKLVFGINVNERMADEDGLIQLFEDGWEPDGATVTTESSGAEAEWDLPEWQRMVIAKIDGRLFLPSEGICGRTTVVQDAIVALMDGAANCSTVTERDLESLEGGNDGLDLRDLTEIKEGDLAGLSSLTALAIGGNGIETLPAGLFDDLDSLRRLVIQSGTEYLPRNIFQGLETVESLHLDVRRMRADGLPDGVFEPLSGLTSFTLVGDERTPRFHATAEVGSGQTLSAGQRVMLGGPGTSGGPWGTNVFYLWSQTDSDDEPARIVTLSSINTATSSFETPVLGTETTVNLTLRVAVPGTPETHDTHGVDTEEFTIKALAIEGFEITSNPVYGGGEYRVDEIIEIVATFGDQVLVDTGQGTPQVGITVGTQTRQATYVRGSGTNRLAFQYTTQASDADTNGISIAADRVTLEGGAITSVWGAHALLNHRPLNANSRHRVDGSKTNALTGGVCERTPQIREKLLALVKTAESDSTLTCAQVTNTHLEALSGTLNLQGNSASGVGTGVRIAGLKSGDFEGLNNIGTLVLSDNLVSEIPSDVFNPLTSMWRLDLSSNKGATATSGLTRIPSGLFDQATGLSELRLDNNNLSSLPARIFEPLTNIQIFSVHSNPGTANFVTRAQAGEDLEVAAGETFTIGAEGMEDGFDDPWGSNVTWYWEESGGSLLGNEQRRVARPQLTAGVTAQTSVFNVRVSGKGVSSSRSEDSIRVEIAAGPATEAIAFLGRPQTVSGNETVYAQGDWIEVETTFDRAVNVNTVSGIPSITINAPSARTAFYRRGSGTQNLVFGYQVQNEDIDNDGADVVENSLTLNGGSIIAISDGGIANLRHSAVRGGDTHKVDGRIDSAAMGRVVLDRPGTRSSDEKHLVPVDPVGEIRAHGGRALDAHRRLLQVSVVGSHHQLRIRSRTVQDPLDGLGHGEVTHVPELAEAEVEVELDLGEVDEHVVQDLRAAKRPLVVVPRGRGNVVETRLLDPTHDQRRVRDQRVPGLALYLRAGLEGGRLDARPEVSRKVPRQVLVHPAGEVVHRAIGVSGVRPVAGAVHAVEAELAFPTGIRVVFAHPANHFVELRPHPPGVRNGRNHGVPVDIGAGNVVMDGTTFDQPGLEHESVEAVVLGEILEQSRAPAVPLVHVVRALAKGNDTLVRNNVSEEAHVFIVIVMARDGQRHDLLTRPGYERLCFRGLVFTRVRHLLLPGAFAVQRCYKQYRPESGPIASIPGERRLGIERGCGRSVSRASRVSSVESAASAPRPCAGIVPCEGPAVSDAVRIVAGSPPNTFAGWSTCPARESSSSMTPSKRSGVDRQVSKSHPLVAAAPENQRRSAGRWDQSR